MLRGTPGWVPQVGCPRLITIEWGVTLTWSSHGDAWKVIGLEQPVDITVQKVVNQPTGRSIVVILKEMLSYFGLWFSRGALGPFCRGAAASRRSRWKLSTVTVGPVWVRKGLNIMLPLKAAENSLLVMAHAAILRLAACFEAGGSFASNQRHL